ncbi:hypothetical protein N2152v2_002495 [Parachlorella kessleri]
MGSTDPPAGLLPQQQQQQQQLLPEPASNGPHCWASQVTLERLRADLALFALERDWGQFHTPRNLLLALTGEVGELAECFQWRGEVKAGLPDFSGQERQAVAEELSDVLLYLVRLSNSCGIDLGQAALSKLQKNREKYPVDKCRGSSAKYTQLRQDAARGSDTAVRGAEQQD